MENPIKMDDLGTPILGNLHMFKDRGATAKELQVQPLKLQLLWFITIHIRCHWFPIVSLVCTPSTRRCQKLLRQSLASDGECGSANGRDATDPRPCWTPGSLRQHWSVIELQAGMFQSCKFCLRNSSRLPHVETLKYEHTESVSAEAFHIFSTLQGSQLIGLWFSSPVWLIYTDAISLWIGLLTSTLIQQQTAVVGYYFPFFTLPYFAKLVYN